MFNRYVKLVEGN